MSSTTQLTTLMIGRRLRTPFGCIWRRSAALRSRPEVAGGMIFRRITYTYNLKFGLHHCLPWSLVLQTTWGWSNLLGWREWQILHVGVTYSVSYSFAVQNTPIPQESYNLHLDRQQTRSLCTWILTYLESAAVNDFVLTTSSLPPTKDIGSMNHRMVLLK